MIDKIIEELIKQAEYYKTNPIFNKSNMTTGVDKCMAYCDAIDIVKKYDNDGWIKGKPQTTLSFVTIKYDDGTLDTKKAFTFKDGQCIDFDDGDDLSDIIIAWQPLPKPYKGDE